MPVSKAKIKANAKNSLKAYDRIELKVPKGYKDIIKAHAEIFQPEIGEIGTKGYSPKGSLNSFINRAIKMAIENDLSE